MPEVLEIINSLRDEFIREANNTPKLLTDLAKVEQYIAESYKTRSFIELIQNADSIVPALPSESVVHSFTPTVEFAGAHIKINGDYTTDPSRKNVDMDEISEESFNNAGSDSIH